jgi:hypothetical protein
MVSTGYLFCSSGARLTVLLRGCRRSLRQTVHMTFRSSLQLGAVPHYPVLGRFWLIVCKRRGQHNLSATLVPGYHRALTLRPGIIDACMFLEISLFACSVKKLDMQIGGDGF